MRNPFKKKPQQSKCDETAICVWRGRGGHLYTNRKAAEKSNYQEEIYQNKEKFDEEIRKISIGNPTSRVVYSGPEWHFADKTDHQDAAKEIGVKLVELFDLDQWYQILQIVTDYKHKEEQIKEKYRQWL